MKVNEVVESAAHMCLLLAALPPDRGLPAARLAEFHELSATSIAKQLQQLAAAGIVNGTKGRTGGYRLARSATQITLLQIVQAVEGDQGGFQCREIRRNGPCAGRAADYSSRCAIASAMDRADAAWREALATTTLADLGSEAGRHLPPRLIASSSAWLERAAR